MGQMLTYHEQISLTYLLSKTHKDGKSKARFLRKFGFDETDVSLLAYNLIEIAQHEEVAEIISNA